MQNDLDREEVELEIIEQDESLGCDVRRYFPSYGWYNGIVIRVRRNALSHEKLYTIDYADDDSEDLDEASFQEARAFFNETPQPTAPIQIIRLLQNSRNDNTANQLTTLFVHPPSPQGHTSPLSSPRSTPTLSEKEAAKSNPDLTPCIGCGGDVTSDYTCPLCHRSLHYFCGAPIDFSSGSPPRHGDPILCRDCKSKTDENERASGQQFILVGEEANRLLVYTGEGGADSITMTICLANNSRLGFTNPFKGVSSLPTITEESKLKKRNPAREIEIHNAGAWVIIPAHLEKKPFLITPTMNFPTNFLPHEVPTFSFHLAEVTLTAKQLSADSLMRGNVYECKEQVDDQIAFCFVLGLLDENNGPRFFGASRIICVIWTTGGESSSLLLLSKTTVRHKKALRDAQLIKSLGIDETKLRDMAQSAEAQLANFLAEPELNNTICRTVDRYGGALGHAFISSESPSVGTNKKGQHDDNDVDEVDITSVKPRKSRSASRRRRSSGKSAKKDCDDAGSNADDDGEDLVDDPSDTLVSLPKKNEYIRVIAAPSVYPRDEERQQHRVGTAIRSPGMSPESVKVRIDFARSAAQNEMWEKIEKDRERRETEERNGFIRAMELQSDSFHKMMDMQSTFAKGLEKREGQERIATAFAAHPNPSDHQRRMFGLLVQASCGQVIVESPPTKSARTSTEVGLSRQTPLQIRAEVDAEAATSSSRQFELQNGS